MTKRCENGSELLDAFDSRGTVVFQGQRSMTASITRAFICNNNNINNRI